MSGPPAPPPAAPQPGPPPGRDPGLQPERTLLAWSRTCLVLTVNALLILRSGLVRAQPGMIALGAVLAAAAGGFYGLAVRRRRAMERADGPQSVRAAPVRALALVVLVVAAGSAWCVLVGPRR